MNRYLEGFRAYRSGLFRWKGALWEESAEGYANRNVLEWVGVIFDFTEWFLFAQRYYEQFLDMTDRLSASLALSKAKGRILISPPNSMPLWNRYASQENEVVIQEVFEIVELRADYAAIARRLARRAFEIFNWNHITDSNIAGWQQKYLSHRL